MSHPFGCLKEEAVGLASIPRGPSFLLSLLPPSNGLKLVPECLSSANT